MKKLYFILSILLISSAVIAQPSLPANKFFTPGTTEVTTDLDPSGLQPGSAGANQTWNFGSATSLGTTNATTFAVASATPYASNFPAANIAGFESGTYSYVNRNAGFLEFLGYGTYDTSSMSNVIITYSNPLRYTNFPLTYNTTSTDTYAASGSNTVSGITYTIYITGSFYSLADGYGTVVTPAGTYTNCIRLKTYQVTRDSIVYSGFPIPATVTENHSISFSWLEASGTYGVERMQVSSDSTFDDTGALTGTGSSARYLSALVTGINSIVNPAATLSIYPNPASDKVTLKADNFKGSVTQLDLYDIRGKKILSQLVELNAGNELSIPVDYLQSGIYTAKISSENKFWSGTFVKK